MDERLERDLRAAEPPRLHMRVWRGGRKGIGAHRLGSDYEVLTGSCPGWLCARRRAAGRGAMDAAEVPGAGRGAPYGDQQGRAERSVDPSTAACAPTVRVAAGRPWQCLLSCGQTERAPSNEGALCLFDLFWRSVRGADAPGLKARGPTRNEQAQNQNQDVAVGHWSESMRAGRSSSQR